jgi:TPP-dependent pyruvate/acetoin dehydrogenase alpha subunit
MQAGASERSLLRTMMLIRGFEEALQRRLDHGFQLFSSGEEAVAVGLCAALVSDDQLLCSGRSIGPALARGLDPGEVMAELLGKAAGPCRGKGGRGHIAAPALGFFGAHAVVAGNLTIAAGVALAMQQQKRPGLVACIFGDGACGSGAMHETLNMAAIWKLPLLLVCDNNQYSVSTPAARVLAPQRLASLASPFGIPSQTVDGMDVLAVRQTAQDMTAAIRSGKGPAFLECISYRFSTHSTATRETRPKAEVEEWKTRCPIIRLTSLLTEKGSLPDDSRRQLADEVAKTINGAIAFADAAQWPKPNEALTDVV